MKQIDTLVYVFIDSGYYVGVTADIYLDDKNTINFVTPIGKFKERLQQEIDDYTFENPLTQEQLNAISLPNRSMLGRKIYMAELKVYVEQNVESQMSLK